MALELKKSNGDVHMLLNSDEFKSNQPHQNSVCSISDSFVSVKQAQMNTVH